MSTTQESTSALLANITGGKLISADSHVQEEPSFWAKRLPAAMRDRMPQFSRAVAPAAHSQQTLDNSRPGGTDPALRVEEMTQDGLAAEVLYPTLGLRLFSLEDAALQEACFRVYNDWLVEYCQVAPQRLYGIACIPAYDIGKAVEELERAKKAGMVGAMVWQVPHADLPFTSDHYDPLWDAAQSLEMPIHLHILTGFDYSALGGGREDPIEAHRGSVNLKLASVTNAVFDLIFSGALERFPRLKVVIVESEIGWFPFVLQQWDYYFRRFRGKRALSFDREPSEFFQRQMYATLFNDAVGGKVLSWWGMDQCMWSTDYPHPNSSWPHSRELLAENLGHLPQETLGKLVRDNVVALYNINLPKD